MKDLTRYATSEPTKTMEAFADFLIANVYGGTLPEGTDEASFRTGVSLGGSTRGYFQASDEWKEDPRNYLANVDANRAAKAAEALDRAKVAAAKAKAREEAAIAKLAAAVEAAKAKAAALAPDPISAEEANGELDGDLAPETEETPSVVTTDGEIVSESAPVPTPPRRSRRGPLSRTREDEDENAA